MGSCLSGDLDGIGHRRRTAVLIRDIVLRELDRGEGYTSDVEETKRVVLEILSDLDRNDVWYDFRMQMRDVFTKIDNLLFLIFVLNNHTPPETTYMSISLGPDLMTRMQIKADYKPYLDYFVRTFAP
jgi:hypothetical protein